MTTYNILREVKGAFLDTHDDFTGTATDAQAHVDTLQSLNGGCWAMQEVSVAVVGVTTLTAGEQTQVLQLAGGVVGS